MISTTFMAKVRAQLDKHGILRQGCHPADLLQEAVYSAGDLAELQQAANYISMLGAHYGSSTAAAMLGKINEARSLTEVYSGFRPPVAQLNALARSSVQRWHSNDVLDQFRIDWKASVVGEAIALQVTAEGRETWALWPYRWLAQTIDAATERFHREDGPAVIHPDGRLEYWKFGERVPAPDEDI